VKKPNFFIIGAPKCGTTSMHEWLAQHPNIFMSKFKEPHYFSEDLVHKRIHNLKVYEQLFQEASATHLCVGESSTNYLYSSHAVKNILSYQPTAKFIVMIRNPIEMVYSLHQQEKYTRNEPIQDFTAAWHAQEKRQSENYKVPIFTDMKLLLYGLRCKVGEQLERLYSQVEASQILVIDLDDVKQDARKVYVDVLKFLDVPDDGQSTFPVANEAKISRWKIIQFSLYMLSYLRKKQWIPTLNTGITKKMEKLI
jgi:hypothetical protein